MRTIIFLPPRTYFLLNSTNGLPVPATLTTFSPAGLDLNSTFKPLNREALLIGLGYIPARVSCLLGDPYLWNSVSKIRAKFRKTSLILAMTCSLALLLAFCALAIFSISQNMFLSSRPDLLGLVIVNKSSLLFTLYVTVIGTVIIANQASLLYSITRLFLTLTAGSKIGDGRPAILRGYLFSAFILVIPLFIHYLNIPPGTILLILGIYYCAIFLPLTNTMFRKIPKIL